MKSVLGPSVYIDPANDSGVEEALFHTGRYEAGTMDFMMQYLKRDSCFVDIGANIGWHSLVASTVIGQNGRILCFEASPKVHQILERNLKVNNVFQASSYACGLGREKSTKELHLNDSINKGASSMLVKAEDADSISVEIWSLDEIVGQLLVRPNMIKIDVEGMEFDVLQGAQKTINKFNPYLIIECTKLSTDTDNRKDLVNYLQTLSNYSWFINRSGKERISPLIEIDIHSKTIPNNENLYGIPKS